MALLRLLCFPSAASNLPTQHHHPSLFFPATAPFSSLPKPHHLLSSFSPLSHPLQITTRKPTLFIIKVSSSTQTEESTVESPELANSGEVKEDESSKTRILAQNVPWSSTADDLRPLFEKYGTVVDIELSMHSKTRNRGLAFITMGSHEEARTALESLENNEYEGRTLRLNWALPKKIRPPPTPPKEKPVNNLFVANLPFQARAKDLKEFFNSEENTNVVTAEIIFLDNPRRSAGYGFVSFNSKAESEIALKSFQGKIFMERPIRLARTRTRLVKDNSSVNGNSSKIEEKVEEEVVKEEEKEVADNA
ncbi:28 kDa ribonucleoprotein, chloroplastic [Impatiens glandulifera]|uniref:28 kDa ribonucleoprotein, chloroplastic n=1 Tax=Impatiens glandulifera TaxID=253017 RepID=UPI001FB0FCE2|nr:28 kDa ribonucleoprotein, chloroplastic [Impatiens glandulifera]